MRKTILEKKLGDMTVRYDTETDSGIAGLCLMTDGLCTTEGRKVSVQPLVDIKVIGDRYSGNYFGGESMKYSETAFSLKFAGQEIREHGENTEIITYLKSENGIEAIHTLSYRAGRSYITVKTEIINNSAADIMLESISSFALYNISPYLEAAGENSILLHRLRAKWSMEGRLVSEHLEDLMLEECWCYGNSKSIRFGQVGSMPAKNYIPFMAVEDTKNGVIWGARIGSPSSWQMEITRADDGVCISGGLSDREFGHWMKKVKTGERFSGMEAVISVCRGDIDDISARLLEAQEDALDLPECEENLPIIFNEYCTTWGNPSHQNIEEILDAIQGKGIDYFVIDCGWFKEDGVRWDISMGDYIPSKSLFPEGMGETVKLINAHSMKAGIWFEIENVGEKSKAYHNEEHLLKRDGITLTTLNRRFWNMNDEWVQGYLTERVIDFMKDNGFGYIKVDYNDTIGIGCDDPDSLGEGLRRNMLASVDFFRKIKREISDIVIENCASGGGRLEPCFMSLSSMASFSDAHECVEIPIIAANLHRAILPRQSQIWCVIREKDTTKRIAYSVAATFLGRMCLSGDVTNLSDSQWQTIERGIEFYKKAVPVIRNGVSKRFGDKIKAYRHPEGYQAVLRTNDTAALLVVHTFANAPERVSVPVGEYKINETYSDKEVEVSIENGVLTLKTDGDFSGYGVLLQKI